MNLIDHARKYLKHYGLEPSNWTLRKFFRELQDRGQMIGGSQGEGKQARWVVLTTEDMWKYVLSKSPVYEKTERLYGELKKRARVARNRAKESKNQHVIERETGRAEAYEEIVRELEQEWLVKKEFLLKDEDTPL